jgi:hypothetical protein
MHSIDKANREPIKLKCQEERICYSTLLERSPLRLKVRIGDRVSVRVGFRVRVMVMIRGGVRIEVNCQEERFFCSTVQIYYCI